MVASRDPVNKPYLKSGTQVQQEDVRHFLADAAHQTVAAIQARPFELEVVCQASVLF